jgi:L-alanine-DL-glutamate epimerase-like enolase superfamily enzyme
MNIEAIRAIQVSGALEHEGEFWEDRLVRPTDLYEPHRQGGPRTLPKLGDGRYRIDGVFLEIEAGGVVGRAGPIGGALAQSILQQFKPLLLGEDARATERIWDLMHRSAVHGRKGPTMMAISAIDCALWDLKGKALDQPVYRLLGGPTRESIPAYASTLGFSVEPEDVARRAAAFAEAGYRAQKWFFKRGPADGKAGMEQNETLVRTVREAAGNDTDIMFDAWMSWDPDYALAMARRVERYNVRWIEEPLLPDKIAATAGIRRRSPVPIATGEHEYTRWGIQLLIDAAACDVIQADTYWAGGISEMRKICTLASVAELPVIPHGHSVSANTHLIASQPPNLCPMAEDLIKWNQVHEFFLRDPVVRERGSLRLPDAPGLGMELDESRIESRAVVGA